MLAVVAAVILQQAAGQVVWQEPAPPELVVAPTPAPSALPDWARADPYGYERSECSPLMRKANESLEAVRPGSARRWRWTWATRCRAEWSAMMRRSGAGRRRLGTATPCSAAHPAGRAWLRPVWSTAPARPGPVHSARAA